MSSFRSDSRGVGVVAVLLAFVIVGVVGSTGWYVWNSNKQAGKNLDNANDASEVSVPTDKTATVPVDTAEENFAFVSTLAGFSMEFPKTWVPEGSAATAYYDGSSPDEGYRISSPNGVTVQYVLLEDDPILSFDRRQIRPDACGTQSSCTLYIVNEIEKFTIDKIGEVQLIKLGSSEEIKEGYHAAWPGYSMELILPEVPEANLKLGKNTFDKSDLSFTIPGKGKDKLHFYVNFSDAYTAKTPEEVFASEDAKTAVEILKSIKFN